MLTNSGLNLGMDNFDGLAPGGSMPGDVSWCGVMDMAGNLDEIASTFEDDQIMKKGGSFNYGVTFDIEHFDNFTRVGASFFTCSHGLPHRPSGAGLRMLVEEQAKVEGELLRARLNLIYQLIGLSVNVIINRNLTDLKSLRSVCMWDVIQRCLSTDLWR